MKRKGFQKHDSRVVERTPYKTTIDVTWGKLLNFSASQFPHLHNGDSMSTYLVWWFGRLMKRVQLKSTVPCTEQVLGKPQLLSLMLLNKELFWSWYSFKEFALQSFMADLDFNKETLAQLNKHPPPQTKLLKGANGDQNQAYLERSILAVTTKRTRLGGPVLLPARYMTLNKVIAPIVLVLHP